jgi:radical SAM superfamily enzyme YgiQ (UPF0313 family)
MKKKNILLINPPKYEVILEFPEEVDLKLEDLAGFFSYASQPSALLRIGALLKKQGHSVRLIDCAAESAKSNKNSIYNLKKLGYRECGNYANEKKKEPLYHCGLSFDELEKELLKLESHPDEIYVSCTMTYHWEPAHKVIEICKNLFPSTKVIFGGIYPTLCPEHAKKSQADKIFVGEIKEANSIEPDLSLLDYKANYIILKLTRGCPNNCSYCAVHCLEGHKMRFISPYKAFCWIKNTLKKYGIRHFIFWESNLLINSKNYFERLLDLIIESRLDLTLGCPEGLQPNLLTQSLANKMFKAGFQTVYMPLETSDDYLSENRFNRKTLTKDFVRAIGFLKNAGFKGSQIRVFILCGFLNQSLDDLLRSMILVWELSCLVRIMPFTPIPKTKEFEDSMKILGKKTLERLHPFLWPLANNDMKVVDLKNIEYFNGYDNPFDMLKKRGAKSKIEKKLLDLINQNSKNLWNNYYEKNLKTFAWLNNNLPDFSVINAVDKQHLRKGKILDIGCGGGKNSAYLKQEGYEAYGIDLADVAIKEARNKLKSENFLQGDILNTNIPENFYDSAIDIGCFHMLDKNQTLEYPKKIKKLLKPNGRFLLRCFSENGPRISRFFPYDNKMVPSPFLNFLKKEDIEKIFEKDFKIIHFKELFWLPIKLNDNKFELKPGMYEFIMEPIK